LAASRDDAMDRGAKGAVFRVALGFLYVAALASVAVLAYRGAPYYLTPLAERARHVGYWDWKPGGSVGRPLGMAGASMMTLMLLYSARKRLAPLRGLGPLSRWLDVHIFLGSVAPLLILLHTSFKFGGLVSLSFWSMVAVALSGVVGRYLYLQIPRTRAGEELTLAELSRLDERLGRRLREEYRLGGELLAELDALAAPPGGGRGVLAGVLRLAVDDFRLRRRLAGFARRCRGLPRGVLREFERVVRQKALCHRRLLLWRRLHEVFHYWHVFHKPFAVVMYVFMVVHVVVAVISGYGGLAGS
jgi:hypothetical protein